MKQTQHCVVSVFCGQIKINIDSDNFLAIAIFMENLYNLTKKDEKTQESKENM